ncbi:MAG: hypothetical protein CVV64_02790 [Candidatus Wallbacteria bacterium HGW-Wallbacteria-1]|jgi:hypothetical protein|uniref:PAS domain-containing protein n=1 Tax=Candidatus Wallbacteria bacterium HGW-Wallbacteria-1 TaxID=2013854 RepID=A0A2N1PTE2_9BACT|nr:MAG: hypothetical protein CVV64_02790 [Candidatus Wallbacteria bacterium HGW-Wallbacteria-1]
MHHHKSPDFIFNSIQDPMVLIDMNLRIIWANRAFLKNFADNLDIEDVKNKFCHQFFAMSHRSCRCCPALDAFNSGKFKTSQLIGIHGNIWNIYAHPLKDEKNNISEILEVFTLNQNNSAKSIHFTDSQPFTEENDHEIRNDSSESTTPQSTAKHILENRIKCDSLLGKISKNLAHTMNNRLTNISINTDIALMDINEDEDILSQDLKSIKEAVTKAAEITKAVLNISRTESEASQSFDLRSVLCVAADFIGSIKGSTPEVICPDDLSINTVSRSLLELLILYIYIEGFKGSDLRSSRMTVTEKSVVISNIEKISQESLAVISDTADTLHMKICHNQSESESLTLTFLN